MSLLSVFDLSYQAGSKPLFSNLSFHINPHDRIGLVGHNGSRKPTLLKLLLNEQVPDSGCIAIQRGLSISQLESDSVLEVVASVLIDRLRIEELYRAESLLTQLGL